MFNQSFGYTLYNKRPLPEDSSKIRLQEAQYLVIIDYDSLFAIEEGQESPTLIGGEATKEALRKLSEDGINSHGVALVLVGNIANPIPSYNIDATVKALKDAGIDKLFQFFVPKGQDQALSIFISSVKGVYESSYHLFVTNKPEPNNHSRNKIYNIALYTVQKHEPQDLLKTLEISVPQDLRNAEPEPEIQYFPSLSTPIKAQSRSLFFEWLPHTYFPSFVSMLFEDKNADTISQSTAYWNGDFSLSNLLKSFVLKTYGFDGYNPATHQITSTDGQTKPYTSDSLPLGLILASILGFPSRPEAVVNGAPKFGWKQFFKNWIGGWDSVGAEKQFLSPKTLDKQRFEKRGWQVAALLTVKLAVILPLKLITWPFKLAINIVKLFTELLPMLLMQATQLLSFLPFIPAKRIDDLEINLGIKIIPFVLLGLIEVPLIALQYATVLLCRAGLALSSPEKSARLAYALGRSLKIDWFGESAEKVISYIMGGLGAIVSLTLSAVLWTLLLPLALGGLVTVFPSITSAIAWVAQLPFIAGPMAWLSSSAVVSSALTLVNNLFITLGGALGTAFGPAITAMATFIGVQISPLILAVGTSLGLLVPPIAAIFSRVADELSDLWFQWLRVPGGPITAIVSFFTSSSKTTAKLKNADEFSGSNNDFDLGNQGGKPPGPEAQRLINDQSDLEMTTFGASEKLDSRLVDTEVQKLGDARFLNPEDQKLGDARFLDPEVLKLGDARFQ